MFSKTVKNNQKVGPTQLSYNQKDDSINFCNYDIKKLNEMISQYLYSILFYKNIIFYRKNNYQMHVENAEKGDPVSQYYIGNCYYYGKNIKQDCDKAIEWYLKSGLIQITDNKLPTIKLPTRVKLPTIKLPTYIGAAKTKKKSKTRLALL